jgi:hypothetical protein
MTGQRWAGRALLLTAIGITAIAVPSHAQRAGDGFLFRPPTGTWTFRGGFARPMANSDVFALVTDQLTVDRSDFSSPTFGTSLGFRLSGRNELMFDVTYAGMNHSSEFRDWVDQNDRPIQQTTSLRRIPITVGVRHYLTSPGRAIGEFAWIPARRSLYIAAGVGIMEYKFRQAGDFVDFATLNVFHDAFVSQGWTPAAHAAAGLDITLGSFTMANFEMRYLWAKAPMGADFDDFDHMDLSGLSVTGGLTFRLF